MLRFVILVFCSIVAGTLLSLPVHARPQKTSGSIDAYVAEHTKGPFDPASEKLTIQWQSKKEYGSLWSHVFVAQAWFQQVYSNDPRQELRHQEGSEFRLQDAYLQYKTEDLVFRIGNQTVVWGEAFGNFYADVVNPKDLRQGLPLDLSSIRLSTPMINARYVTGGFSIQGILLPQPQFNLLPLPVSDYSPPLAEITGFRNVSVVREKSLPMSMANKEVGVKISQVVGSADISLFNFEHYDRNPSYTVSDATVPFSELVLQEHHDKVTSSGATLAMDIGGYVLRTEAILIRNRRLPVKDGLAMKQLETNELNYVASVDLPTIDRLNASLQYSENKVEDEGEYLVRPKQVNRYGSVRGLWTIGEASSFELVAVYSLGDTGWRLQMEYMNPVSERFEFRLGSGTYGGPSDSEFGRLPRASQVYTLLKYYF